MLDILKWINNNIVWGTPMLLLFTAVGVLFTVRLKYFQLIKLPFILKNTLFRRNVEKNGEGISPFRTLTASLGTTLGTGNIIAVGAAVAMGGAGAVFWMWIAAILGMITTYAENYLGNKYRSRSADEDFNSVPFLYIRAAFKSERLGKSAAAFFAVCCIGASFGMGNMAQVNSAGTVLNICLGVPVWATGIICAVVTAFLCCGGLKKLTDCTVRIIPAITLLYIAGCLTVIIINIDKFPKAVSDIFTEAFSIKAVTGGTSGLTIINAMQWGVKRGIFSNEAGLGTSVIINAGSSAGDGKTQGMWAMLQVFIDTIIMCSMTALCILCSNAESSASDGLDMAYIAFDSGLGNFAGAFIAVSVLIFALSTVAGWYHYGKSCVTYLLSAKWLKVYYFVFIALAFTGAVLHSSAVWELSDFFNGIMAIPNLIALILLRKEIKV